MRRLLLGRLMIVGSILLPSGVADATPPSLASGTFVFTSVTYGSLRVADGNTFLETLTNTRSWSGTFTGTDTFDGIVTVHPTGHYNARGFGAFTGSVEGRSGTMTYRFEATGELDGSSVGHLTVLSGTGGLANLRGQVTVEFVTAAPGGTYSGHIHFDP